MKVSVIVFPGSNCDRDIKVAISKCTGVNPGMIWHGDGDLPKSDLIILPGGFSFGDYLRSGAIAANSPIMKDVLTAAKRGVRILAICNGFQIATEAGLLPGVLLPNVSLKFICKDVYLRVENQRSTFTQNYKKDSVVRMPIAHRDGNYFAAKSEIEKLNEKGQIAFRYCSAEGIISDLYNPNGSIGNIAGIYNESKNILGMMPHPERLADIKLGGDDGKLMFHSILSGLKC